MRSEVRDVQAAMEAQGYIAEPAICTAVYLATAMHKPLLVEGDAGVGKTELAKVVAAISATELIRLQCYEGLDSAHALYEWNYQKQLLRLRIESTEGAEPDRLEERIYDRSYLLERPLLRAITRPDKAPVLLIDEIDRADDAFEAFLLELLSDFQVTIPELGTIVATHRPFVVLTSNRTRDIGDALRRRCLYLYVELPSYEKELRIVRSKVAGIDEALAEQVAHFVQGLREHQLIKPPGVAETLDWAWALVQLNAERLDLEIVQETLGCLLKDRHDLGQLQPSDLDTLVTVGSA